MRVINKSKHIHRLYRFNSLAIILCVTLLMACSFWFIFEFCLGTICIPAIILSFIFFGLCIGESISIGNCLIYMDQATTFGNASYVMMHAVKLSMGKKLHKYAGLFINIKDFKYINQRYGLDNGDLVIRLVHYKFTQYAKKHHAFAGRLGGDNYYVLVRKDNLSEFLDFMQNFWVNIDFEGEDTPIHIKFRAGINEVEDDSMSRTLIFYSSIALSVAREVMQDVVCFQPYMLDNFVRSKRLITDSKYALKNNEFIPFYQPKVNLKNGRMCGAEALVRWKKEGRLILPCEYVPALESSGTIIDVDFRVFEIVCQDIRSWIDSGVTPVRISTNFSKINLKNNDFISRILEIKDKYQIDGKYLEIELTESAGVNDFRLIQKFADEINKYGISVAIDDFGTGYSSLSMLQAVHTEVIKMDKSFLDNSFRDEKKQFIIDVINIVKHQNQLVLFEGVETKEQLNFLKENGCDIVQGFIFDKPLPHDDFEKRLVNPEY